MIQVLFKTLHNYLDATYGITLTIVISGASAGAQKSEIKGTMGTNMPKAGILAE